MSLAEVAVEVVGRAEEVGSGGRWMGWGERQDWREVCELQSV
jgi:hypothetical protein